MVTGPWCGDLNEGTWLEQDAPAIHLSYHDGEHYNSVRRADDHTSGPPLPIAIAERAPTSAEKAAARSWGAAEEDLVMRGTGCYDSAAVQQALEDAHGNADQVLHCRWDNPLGSQYLLTANMVAPVCLHPQAFCIVNWNLQAFWTVVAVIS